MPNRVYLQFYTEWKQEREIMGDGCYVLYNGLSEVWRKCDGDFVWMRQDYDNYLKDASEFTQYQAPPIKKGQLHISACGHWTQLYQAYMWAQRYPGLKITVGGGNIFDKLAWEEKDLPVNMRIETRSANDYYGMKPMSEWKLAFGLPADARSIQFGYRVGQGCYWGKCPYCINNERYTERQILHWEFANLWPDFPKSVYLASPSITPNQLKSLLASLPARDDFSYMGFIRGTAAEADAIRKGLGHGNIKASQLRLRIGVEMPSSRMHKFLDRGMSVTELYDTLQMLDELGVTVVQQYIWGWNNLTWPDLQEFEWFVDGLYKKHAWFKLNRLHAYYKMPWFEQFPKGEERTFGPFKLGFPTKITRGEHYLMNVVIKEVLAETGRLIQAGGDL